MHSAAMWMHVVQGVTRVVTQHDDQAQLSLHAAAPQAAALEAVACCTKSRLGLQHGKKALGAKRAGTAPHLAGCACV
jgi:hypothetical protein